MTFTLSCIRSNTFSFSVNYTFKRSISVIKQVHLTPYFSAHDCYKTCYVKAQKRKRGVPYIIMSHVGIAKRPD